MDLKKTDIFIACVAILKMCLSLFTLELFLFEKEPDETLQCFQLVSMKGIVKDIVHIYHRWDLKTCMANDEGYVEVPIGKEGTLIWISKNIFRNGLYK